MKTSILMFAFLVVAISLNAQTGKGQWLVGGNVNFSSANTKNSNAAASGTNKSTSLQFLPDAGYFFLSRFYAGIRTGLIKSNIKARYVDNHSISQSESNVTTLALSPFVRYYFLPSLHKINILADISYSYNHNSDKEKNTQQNIDAATPIPTITSNSSESKYHTSAYTFAAGPVLFLNPKVALELTLGYTIAKYLESGSSNGFIAGAGFQVHLGE